MKKATLFLMAIGCFAAFNACKKSSSTPANTASMMFVNACTGTSGVSATANNVTTASNLAFTQNSAYISVTAGSAANIGFSVIGSGLTTPLVSGTANLTANTRYSAFAGGIFTAPVMVVTTDDLTPPTGTNAKVRFINLSSDNLNASCFIGNTKIDSNIAYRAYSPFREVATITDKVTMLDPIAPTNTAQILSQTFGPGKIYTVMLTGSSAGTGVAALKLTVIANN